MQFRNALIQVNDKTFELLPGRANTFEDFYVEFSDERSQTGEIALFLHPKADILVQQLELTFFVPYLSGQTRFFANGFQSWSESKEMGLDERMRPLNVLARKYFGNTGHSFLKNIPFTVGNFHSWTYTYFRNNREYLFFGSLNENTGFTVFSYNVQTQILTVKKVMDALALSHSFPLMHLYIGSGTEREVFEQWAHKLPGSGRRAPGQNNASAPQILENDIYSLIGDGWQVDTGDWLKPDAKQYANGLNSITADARAQGIKPGLWIAPFVCSKNSEIFRKNPDWILKDKQNKPLNVGWNAQWGGWYYALNFYNAGVREYLSGVFHLILDRWGFQMVALDYLFAVCLNPPASKTSGQVMHEAMEFLRHQCGDKIAIAGGAPLGSTLGLADYWGFDAEIHSKWESRFHALLDYRERRNTLVALRSLIGRRQVNKMVFQGDPGICYLGKATDQLTPQQKRTVLLWNRLFGALQFTAAMPSETDNGIAQWMAEIQNWKTVQIHSVEEIIPDFYEINTSINHKIVRILTNLARNKRRFTLYGKRTIIQPFESIVLSKELV